MLIRIGYDITYECAAETPMILTLHVHPTRARDLRLPDSLKTTPYVPVQHYLDRFDNWCTRLKAPAGTFNIRADGIIEDTGEPDRVVPHARQLPVESLPESTLIYLLGSRYCETDLLSPIAWQLFGQSPEGWGRVQAICDFVHQHLQFGYEHARATRTAWEAYNERRGVCRDFAHLAITLCRAMNIPARYCTGYLGDIGVPPVDCPMDFSGWFEAYLDGQWYSFDARHNVPRIGRIVIARGRDATDVAITTLFGSTVLSGFKVWTDEVDINAIAQAGMFPGDSLAA